MSKPKIVFHEGISIDLSNIKCIKLLPKYAGDLKRVMIVFKTRYQYLLNPNTGIYDREEVDDYVELKYDTNEDAKRVLLEFNNLWQKYLEE